LKPAKVLQCPECQKQFVEGRWRGRYPQRFCNKNCSRTAWRKQQAAFLEAGRKKVAEAAAAGLVGPDDAEMAEWDRASKELDKLFFQPPFDLDELFGG
jgi:hypothetical protein